MGIKEWVEKRGWRYNPFTFEIRPDLFVGYNEQKERILSAIASRHKFILVLGPTGSGKTTFLKWLESSASMDVLYLCKPPKRPEEFIEIFNMVYKPFPVFGKRIRSIYEMAGFLNEKTKDRPLLILCDEVHETSKNVLEWLRVISDQCNIILVFSALPVFESTLMQKLETLRKRVACRIELFSLTKEETEELIRRRIEGVGGRGLEPFSQEAVNFIYEQSAGFPREVLRLCNELVNRAAEKNTDTIMPDLVERREEAAKVDLNVFSDKQKQILEQLIQPMTPTELVNTIGMENYTSATHAIRSINNMLKRMMELGYVERTKKQRSYIYSLSARLRTIFITK